MNKPTTVAEARLRLAQLRASRVEAARIEREFDRLLTLPGRRAETPQSRFLEERFDKAQPRRFSEDARVSGYGSLS